MYERFIELIPKTFYNFCEYGSFYWLSSKLESHVYEENFSYGDDGQYNMRTDTTSKIYKKKIAIGSYCYSILTIVLGYTYICTYRLLTNL